MTQNIIWLPDIRVTFQPCGYQWHINNFPHTKLALDERRTCKMELDSAKNTDVSNKVKAYKDTLNKKAEHLIKEGLLEKIVELNELFETVTKMKLPETQTHIDIPMQDLQLTSNGIEKHCPNGGVLPNSSQISEIPCNETHVALTKLLKPFVEELFNDIHLLKMWVLLKVPKIEDGNNFGVGVQKDIITEIEFAELEAVDIISRMTRCYSWRGRLVSKLVKYPQVADYRKAVKEMDYEEHQWICNAVNKLRDRYCLLQDVISKNLDKIKMPRSSNGESMY